MVQLKKHIYFLITVFVIYDFIINSISNKCITRIYYFIFIYFYFKKSHCNESQFDPKFTLIFDLTIKFQMQLTEIVYKIV